MYVRVCAIRHRFDYNEQVYYVTSERYSYNELRRSTVNVYHIISSFI